MQWNDRFRDDVRAFLRGRAGMVPALRAAGAGQPRPVRLADGQRQLRDVPRRVHAVRPRRLRPQAQRGQRLGRRPRRRGRQPVVELRVGGRRRRARRGARAAPAPAAQRVVPAGAVPRRADGGDGRRARAHPGRQQQRLQPGQRDVVGRLGAGRRSSPTWSAFVGELLALRARHPVLSPADVVGRRACGSAAAATPTGHRVAGLAGRRPLRHRQRVVGAARVRRPGARRPRGAGSSTRRWPHPTTSSA